MPIAIECGCGRRLRVKDEFAGRKVRCPVCAEVVTAPPATGAADEAMQVLLTETPPVRRKPRPPQPPPLPPEPEVSARRGPPPRPILDDEPPPKKKPKKKKRSRGQPSRWSGIAIHPAIVTGVFMMIGAVVWFFAGLAAGYIFFYPPILFVLGIVSIVKGFTGGE
jgi:hypothetical protein